MQLKCEQLSSIGKERCLHFAAEGDISVLKGNRGYATAISFCLSVAKDNLQLHVQLHLQDLQKPAGQAPDWPDSDFLYKGYKRGHITTDLVRTFLPTG